MNNATVIIDVIDKKSGYAIDVEVCVEYLYIPETKGHIDEPTTPGFYEVCSAKIKDKEVKNSDLINRINISLINLDPRDQQD